MEIIVNFFFLKFLFFSILQNNYNYTSGPIDDWHELANEYDDILQIQTDVEKIPPFQLPIDPAILPCRGKFFHFFIHILNQTKYRWKNWIASCAIRAVMNANVTMDWISLLLKNQMGIKSTEFHIVTKCVVFNLDIYINLK